MEREFTVIIEKDEDNWFIANVPELEGCHTQAKTLDELMKRIREAIKLCLKEKEEITNTTLIGIQKIVV
ncbi:MAG: HicB family protein [Candidatus Diapherotrites archaeon CG08_land_8_20_14_0_20_34_12]|nr:MAG: HicB family protein [Candidatus Diapherotrites archaeon CG08_land_8_20_14_0_20_34_12]